MATRLEAQQRRLYAPDAAQAGGFTRALVLAVDGPGSWEALAAAWQGVQSELLWPAPAIALTGEGYALWFSLQQPLPQSQAQALLQALAARFLGGVAPSRLRLDAAPGGAQLPPRDLGDGRWCAFVTPGLATVFADEPWVDVAPGLDAQAEVLAALASIPPEDLARVTAPAPGAADTPAPPRQEDPRRFLLDVMNDAGAPLALRVEAAKALLAANDVARR